MIDLTPRLLLGDFREVLPAALPEDRAYHVVVDPPFSERTHGGQRHGRSTKPRAQLDTSKHPLLSTRGFNYASWDEHDIATAARMWVECTGWVCVFTSHDLIPLWEEYLADYGRRYVFAPVACVQEYRNVRLAGDGPSNWTDYLIVSRPRKMSKWGALPGAYCGPSFDVGENALDRSKRIVPGGKPGWLMRSVVRDYSRVGDLVVDPCAGGGETLVAARSLQRPSLGCEIDPVTHAAASARLARPVTSEMFTSEAT